jgi:hypothetical protein
MDYFVEQGQDDYGKTLRELSKEDTSEKKDQEDEDLPEAKLPKEIKTKEQYILVVLTVNYRD